MKYYMILLNDGIVVEICSYDDEESWIENVNSYQFMLSNMTGLTYNQIQILTQV